MKVMPSGFRRAMVRFRYVVGWNLAIVMILFTANVSAQDFEEIPVSSNDHHVAVSSSRSVQTERIVPQHLPAVVSPNSSATQTSSTGIAFASGTDQSGNVVLAQFQGANEPSVGQATLPSIRLAQGTIPRLASIEKNPPMPSTFPGAGQITLQETDGTTPTVTRRPSTKAVQELSSSTSPAMSPVTRSQRPATDSGIVNAYVPQGEEIIWDQTGQQGNYETYETLPGQLGRMSGYAPENIMGGQYELQADPYSAGFYGSEIYGASDYYPYGQAYGPNVYGQGVYGYGYGACPPIYSHGLLAATFSHILCSNTWENLTVGFGGSGFKSPISHANGGAFGFSESLNWASPSTSMMPLNLQAGFRTVQAFPSGYEDVSRASWHRSVREQYFGTIGVFRRNIGCTPLNLGVAYDVMRDKYYDDFDLEQLRSEISYGGLYGYEFGYRGSYNLKGDSMQFPFQNRVSIRTVDYHTLFVKKYFANGGEGSLAGGATEYGDFMVRADYNIPLSNEWGLKNSFSYVVPKGGHSPSSPQRESWDVSLQLIYQPRGGMLAGFCNPFRAMFDVADNGTMIQRGR